MNLMNLIHIMREFLMVWLGRISNFPIVQCCLAGVWQWLQPGVCSVCLGHCCCSRPLQTALNCSSGQPILGHNRIWWMVPIYGFQTMIYTQTFACSKENCKSSVECLNDALSTTVYIHKCVPCSQQEFRKKSLFVLCLAIKYFESMEI